MALLRKTQTATARNGKKTLQGKYWSERNKNFGDQI